MTDNLKKLVAEQEAVVSKYLSYENRLEIEAGLRRQLSFGEIAEIVGKDRTTIAKEIKRYCIKKKSGYPGWPYNACVKRKGCRLKKICADDKCTRNSIAYCKLCPRCNENCSEFREEICIHHSKPPYVCNGCEQLGKCTLKKTLYSAIEAHQNSQACISESRSGVLTSEAEIERLNALITPLVKNGQPLHQIYLNHIDELMCSEKTLYNYVDACLFDIRNIDLPRKVKYRLRFKKPEFKIDRACRNGRTYVDFQLFNKRYPETHIVQSVIDIYNDLFDLLGRKVFKNLFPVILTDNGSEFSNPKAIEFTREKTVEPTFSSVIQGLRIRKGLSKSITL